MLSPIPHTVQPFSPRQLPLKTSKSYPMQMTSQSHPPNAKNNTAAKNAQHYLNTLQTWLITNKLKVAPEKSTAILITNYKQEYNHNNLTPVTLYNTPITYTNKVKILRVTYDNGFTFKEHIADIKLRCTPKLRALKAITGQDFGQSKETTTTIHKQFIRSVTEYCSTSWTVILSDTHYNTVQVQ